MNYDRRGIRAPPEDRRRIPTKDDSAHVFEGWYDPKTPSPRHALDDLAKAMTTHIQEFERRMWAQITAASELTSGEMKVTNEEVRRLIVKYIVDEYHVEKTLAQGLADQLIHGENY